MSNIDITGIAKHKILQALFNASKQQGLGILDKFGALPMDEMGAQEIVRGMALDGYPLRFDYLRGRIMKVDLSDDTLDPYLFDRDNGSGAAAAAIDSIR